MLFLLYTMDIPQIMYVMTSQFADDTAIVAHDADYNTVITKLQSAVTRISDWTRKWKITLNDSKSIRVDFTLRPHHYTPTILEGKPIPLASSARYLGLHLDNKLNWHEHIANKRRMLDLLKKKFYWLIGPRSKLSFSNKK